MLVALVMLAEEAPLILHTHGIGVSKNASNSYRHTIGLRPFHTHAEIVLVFMGRGPKALHGAECLARRSNIRAEGWQLIHPPSDSGPLVSEHHATRDTAFKYTDERKG